VLITFVAVCFSVAATFPNQFVNDVILIGLYGSGQIFDENIKMGNQFWRL